MPRCAVTRATRHWRLSATPCSPATRERISAISTFSTSRLSRTSRPTDHKAKTLQGGAKSTMKIESLRARQLIDCMCRPMVEVEVETEGGFVGRGAAPTGQSVGMHEAFVLRDNDPHVYNGLSVN